MFFDDFSKWGDRVAVYDATSGVATNYADLDVLVSARAAELGGGRQLIFVEAKNTLQTVVDYLACLRARHVVHLLDSLSAEKTDTLVKLYKPQLLINAQGQISRLNNPSLELHPELAVLLSTSGSTGSPKFVKLSRSNIQSNAESICVYLQLTPEDRALCHLKLHYSYGMSILNSHLQAGAAVILTDDNIMDSAFWESVDTYQATSFAGVPYTFETLLHLQFDIRKHPSLKYVTQAGGKLESGLVKTFAEKLAVAEVQFFVMYGQTEAAPRISYLPPELATTYPHTIGKAIPGGKLFLVDEQGAEITQLDVPGELAYQGPNVMLGYAEAPEELASDQTPDRLLTGDIACRTEHDLFYIVGRTKRFVKPFGIRVNLDEIQSQVKLTHPQSAVTGDDQRIILALKKMDDETAAERLIPELAQRYALPEHVFLLRWYDELPLMASNKYDYKKIMEDQLPTPERISFFRRVGRKIADILELNATEWESILALYRKLLSSPANPTITSQDSFNGLATDSLSFVSLSIEMENCFGEDLPQGWQDMPIAELDALYQAKKLG